MPAAGWVVETVALDSLDTEAAIFFSFTTMEGVANEPIAESGSRSRLSAVKRKSVSCWNWEDLTT